MGDEDRFDRFLSRLGRTTGLVIFTAASVVALAGHDVNPLIFSGSLGLYGLLKVPDIITALRRSGESGGRS